VKTDRGVRIRVATARDVPGILRCLRAAFESYRTDYTHGAFRDTVLTRDAARERLRSMAVLVAVEPSGAVVGTLAWGTASPVEAHLRGMAIVPAFQGKGVAASLLSRALAHIWRSGHTRVTLDTTLPLTRARRFYERNGFRPSGRVTDFFGMPLVEYALNRRPVRRANEAVAPRATGRPRRGTASRAGRLPRTRS
jgi:GNAT superfamily N-acetyltransferase